MALQVRLGAAAEFIELTVELRRHRLASADLIHSICRPLQQLHQDIRASTVLESVAVPQLDLLDSFRPRVLRGRAELQFDEPAWLTTTT